MPVSLHSLSPFRVIIGTEDVTAYLADSWSFSNVDPGGYEACSLTFPKDMTSTIRGLPILITSGLSTAWEGRVQQVQRSLGHNTIVMGEGYGALFKDHAGSMVFVDRDLTRWGAPSVTRQAMLVAANFQLASGQVAADPTGNTPALVQSITDSWASPSIPINESWYDAGPVNLVAKLYYALSLSQSGGPWQATVQLASDAETPVETTSNLGGSSSASGYFAPVTAYRFAMLQHFYNSTPAGAQGAIFNAYWESMAAYGNHGLTGRGTDPVGFYPSDIFGWVLDQTSGLQAGVVQQTDVSGFILPHSAYYTPVTLDQIVGDMATAQGWHWGVWESLNPLTGNATPRADFRARPAPGAFTAFCHRRDCSTLDIREDLTQQYNTAVVNFGQVDGTQGSVTVTTTNPVLDAAGIAARTVVFQAGTMTPATAAVFAAEALALTNAQVRVSGTAEIINAIDGGSRPAWLLKSGIDRLRVGDAPSTDAFGATSDYPINRVETSVSSGGFTAAVEIGSGANLVETLQARLTAATSLSQGGG